MSKNKKKESKQHLKMKEKFKSIFEKIGFNVDTEVHLDIDGDGRDDISFDVCAVSGKNMFVIQCKDRKSIDNIKKEISSWEQNSEEIKKNKYNIKILNSDYNTITNTTFSNINKIFIAFAFNYELQDLNKDITILLNSKDIPVFDKKAIKYFDKTSSTIGEWMKYEIFREFGLSEEIQNTHYEKAICIRQSGYPEIYVMGMHPGLLLKIAYVMRRVSQKPDAYQRMINKDKIEKLSKFLSQNNIILPNAIIIAFDSDEEVQKKLVYDEKEGKLAIPIKYSSAWIIDGQHRVYGFIKTKYKNWHTDLEINDEFKLPVVAFKSLEETIQNKLFVSINYNQKKIDKTLLCDLAAATKDLKNELTWPSLLVTELNNKSAFKNLIKISEFDENKPITLSSFTQYAFLMNLLGFEESTQSYNGPMYKYSPFDTNLVFNDTNNLKAFDKQIKLLEYFFSSIRKIVGDDIWTNKRSYSITKATGVNALLLVLYRIFEKHPAMDLDFMEYLKPLKSIDWSSESIVKAGGGWKGFRNLANKIIRKLRKHNKENLKYFPKRKK